MTSRLIIEDNGQYKNYFIKSQNGTNQVGYQPGKKLDDHPYQLVLSYGERGRFNYQDGDGNILYTSDLDQELPVFTPTLTDNDRLKVINKLNQKIRGSSFSGSNFLIEGHQTLSLLTTQATRLAQFYHYLKRGRLYDAAKYVGMDEEFAKYPRNKLNTLKKLYKSYASVAFRKNSSDPLKSTLSIQADIKRASRDAADLVLEYQYGVAPLWSDLHESAKSLAQRTVFPEKVNFKATRQINGSLEFNVGGLKVRSHGTSSIHVKIKLKRPPNFSEQLNFGDLRGALWEGSPWSFVVDWALPVQQWLGALDFAQTWEIDTMCTSTRIRGSSQAVGIVSPEEFFGIGTTQTVQFTSGSSLPNAYTTTLDRVTNVLSFADALTLLPEFKPLDQVFGVEHSINALALLVSNATSFGRTLKF